MDILVGCEHSGAVRDALISRGHNAVSVDLKPSPDASPGTHYVGDIFDLLPGSWDALIAFPPCTFLAKARLWDKSPARIKGRSDALDFVLRLYYSGVPRVAIENPIGHLSAAFRPPDQIVYPWWFGDPYRKDVCLWLKDLPPLIATCYNPIRKPIANHVNGRMSPAMKSEIKSSWKWFPGMVDAMVSQWFPLTLPTVRQSSTEAWRLSTKTGL